MNKRDSDELVMDIDPLCHPPHEADRLHLHSVDHSNLLLAIYATLRRIEDHLRMDSIVVTATCKACVEWTMVTPDYNKNFIDELKAAIPMDKREWVPAAKCWLVQGDWIHLAADIAHKYFPKAECRWVE